MRYSRELTLFAKHIHLIQSRLVEDSPPENIRQTSCCKLFRRSPFLLILHTDMQNVCRLCGCKHGSCTKVVDHLDEVDFKGALISRVIQHQTLPTERTLAHRTPIMTLVRTRIRAYVISQALE